MYMPVHFPSLVTSMKVTGLSQFYGPKPLLSITEFEDCEHFN